MDDTASWEDVMAEELFSCSEEIWWQVTRVETSNSEESLGEAADFVLWDGPGISPDEGPTAESRDQGRRLMSPQHEITASPSSEATTTDDQPDLAAGSSQDVDVFDRSGDLPMHTRFQLPTKNEPWKGAIPQLQRRALSSNGESSQTTARPDQGSTSLLNLLKKSQLPASGPEVNLKQCLVAGDRHLFCIDLFKAGGPKELVMYNVNTDECKALPSLIHDRRPVLMHLKVDDSGGYRLIVAGSSAHISTEDLSSKTEEYSSATGKWECTGNLPHQQSLNELYQNGAYHKDRENREFLYALAFLDPSAAGTRKGLIKYDLKKKEWQDSIELPMPDFVRSDQSEVSESNVIYAVTTRVVGCSGSVFLYSEHKIGKDVYSCIHELHPGTSGDEYLRTVILKPQKRTREPSWLESGLQVYPDFPCELPLCATVVEPCDGSAFIFSEEKSGKDTLVYIRKLGPRGVWEEILRRMKITRHRSTEWKEHEIDAFLALREEALEEGVKEGQPTWEYISKAMINRGFKQCQNQWDTLVRRSKTDAKNPLKKEWKEIMERISEKRTPRNLKRVRSRRVRDEKIPRSQSASQSSLVEGSVQNPAPGSSSLGISSMVANMQDTVRQSELTFQERLRLKELELEISKENNKGIQLEIEKLKYEKERDHAQRHLSSRPLQRSSSRSSLNP